jgi:hypothetical protein
MKNNLKLIFFASLFTLLGNAYCMTGGEGTPSAFQTALRTCHEEDEKIAKVFEEFNKKIFELIRSCSQKQAEIAQIAQHEGRKITSKDIMDILRPVLQEELTKLFSDLPSEFMTPERTAHYRARIEEELEKAAILLVDSNWHTIAQQRITAAEKLIKETEERTISIQEIVDIMMEELFKAGLIFEGMPKDAIDFIRTDLTAQVTKALPANPLTR